jgi:hypothetical protein
MVPSRQLLPKVYGVLLVWGMQALLALPVRAQPEDYEGTVAGEQWTVLHAQRRPTRNPVRLPRNAPVVSLEEFQFIGPEPSHRFVLGNFAVDGEFGLNGGYLQPIKGRNAALQLAWADQFELQGTMEQTGLGGWFLLIGWDEGRGHAIFTFSTRESGSPWFVSEFRGTRAIEGRTVKFPRFEWKGEQPFRIAVQQDELSITVGNFKVLEDYPLENYSPGRIVLGVYDTEYGPKPLRIKELRIRAREEGEPEPE